MDEVKTFGLCHKNASVIKWSNQLMQVYLENGYYMCVCGCGCGILKKPIVILRGIFADIFCKN